MGRVKRAVKKLITFTQKGIESVEEVPLIEFHGAAFTQKGIESLADGSLG